MTDYQPPNPCNGTCAEGMCGGISDYYGPCGGCCSCWGFCSIERDAEQYAEYLNEQKEGEAK